MENGLDKGEDARMSTMNVETRIVHSLWIIHLQGENSREEEGWKCLEASAWRVLNIQLFGGRGGPWRVSEQVNDSVSLLLPVLFFSPLLPFPFSSPPCPPVFGGRNRGNDGPEHRSEGDRNHNWTPTA